MSLWLWGSGGVVLFLSGLAAGFYPLVGVIWLAAWLSFVGMTILWVRRVNSKIESMLSSNPDPVVINRVFTTCITDFARADTGLSGIYKKMKHKDSDHLNQKARYAGENLDLLIMSTTDPLTGVQNRNQLNIFMKKALGRLEPLSLIMADIDFFKRINDTYGHDAGDMVLKQFSGVVRRSVRPLDQVFRFGGEEFMVICEAGLEAAVVIAERIRESVEKSPLAMGGRQSVNITASFGVALHRPGDTPEDIIKRADEALYRAKGKGRNRVEVEGVLKI